MNRAASRRRGKRKEAERKERMAAEALAMSKVRMWRKLTDTSVPKIDVGYQGADEMDAPAFYCPYIPIMKTWVVRVGDE